MKQEKSLQYTIESENKAKTAKIIGLIREIWGKGTFCPRHKKLAELVRLARLDRRRFKRSTSPFQEALDFLRVCIKYQRYDLEATRRENAILRELLQENNE